MFGQTLKSPLAAPALIALVLGAACRTLPELPVVDFAEPGWHVQRGQAVWKPAHDKPELAGELLLATNRNGRFFVQFSKPPFTLATAQSQNGFWEIRFGSGDYDRCGRGQPPVRFSWFQLPRALAGAAPFGHWQFEGLATNSWKLENPRSGESLVGNFSP